LVPFPDGSREEGMLVCVLLGSDLSESMVSSCSGIPCCVIVGSARKRNKKAANAKLSKNRIYIGDEYDRWMEIKTALRLETNSEVAKILLDR
jgi:hypothetical protein